MIIQKSIAFIHVKKCLGYIMEENLLTISNYIHKITASSFIINVIKNMLRYQRSPVGERQKSSSLTAHLSAKLSGSGHSHMYSTN